MCEISKHFDKIKENLEGKSLGFILMTLALFVIIMIALLTGVAGFIALPSFYIKSWILDFAYSTYMPENFVKIPQQAFFGFLLLMLGITGVHLVHKKNDKDSNELVLIDIMIWYVVFATAYFGTWVF